MKRSSILGQSVGRFAASLLPAATLLLLLVSPAGAQSGGLEAAAPENLRCPGRAGPQVGRADGARQEAPDMRAHGGPASATSCVCSKYRLHPLDA